MTRENFSKAEEIVRVLNRIDSVLETTTIIHNNKTTFKHFFKEDVSKADLLLLCKLDVKESFLKILYEKKLELEKELEKL